MSQHVFWVWNGWGILFLFLFSLYLPATVLAIEKFGGGTPIRGVTRFLALFWLILVFVFSGWKAGLISIPTGFILGLFFCGMLHYIMPK